MRPIDADALMNELMKVRWAYQMLDNTQRADIAMGGLRNAEKKVEEAPTIDAVPRWIPCKERLPELDEICLVTEKDGSIRHCYFDSVDPVLFATVEEGMYVKNVVAWMPLPEPYEGERKDDD